MRILKIKKLRNNYKTKCYYCNSKLLVDYEDIITVCTGTINISFETTLTYKCPVCGGKNYLSGKNKHKYYAYQNYIKAKEEDKKNV